jgi:hypothetical protein
MKKEIRIKFVDFYKGFDPNDFIDILAEKYIVILSDSPDYIFYSCFGYEHLRYNCIRIFYTGECITPNFNECDYAIGFDRLEFGDRYIRIPLYRMFKWEKEYPDLVNRKKFTMDDLKGKEGFCSFVYSNCFAQDSRNEIFDKLNQYKKVSSGGRYRNNTGGAVSDKLEFQKKYKFVIAFENTVYDGYATEKLVDAFASYAIPIYYGDPQIAKDFNPKSFINCHEYASFDKVVERVREIDNNDELFMSIINEPPIVRLTDNPLKNFLFGIFDQECASAFRRPFSSTAISEEKMKLRHRVSEKMVYSKIQKVKNTIVRIKTGTIIMVTK